MQYIYIYIYICTYYICIYVCIYIYTDTHVLVFTLGFCWGGGGSVGDTTKLHFSEFWPKGSIVSSKSPDIVARIAALALQAGRVKLNDSYTPNPLTPIPKPEPPNPKLCAVSRVFGTKRSRRARNRSIQGLTPLSQKHPPEP